MPLSNPITEPQIPQPIARDSEITAAIAGHVAATDPHTQYLLQAEGDARYRLTSTALTDSDIPAAIARDSEVTAAVAAHVATVDPHPSLWNKMLATFARLAGGQRWLKNNPAMSITSYAASQNHMELATSDGSNPIIGFHRGGFSATALYHAGHGANSLRIHNADGYDAELLHKVNHLDEANPHPQYLTQQEADANYPKFKRLIITGACPNQANGTTFTPHGLTESSIQGFTAFVTIYPGTISESRCLPGGLSYFTANKNYSVDIGHGQIRVRLGTAAQSGGLFGAQFTIAIDYI